MPFMLTRDIEKRMLPFRAYLLGNELYMCLIFYIDKSITFYYILKKVIDINKK